MRDNGCLITIISLLWLLVVACVPQLFGDNSWCPLLATGFGIGIGVTIIEHPDTKGFIKKKRPFTYLHWLVFQLYTTLGIFTIGFTDKSYYAIKGIGKSALFYAILPIIVFIIESSISNTANKKGQD